MSIRFLNGFIELNYEPVAKLICPEQNINLVECAILGAQDERGGYDEGYDAGAYDGWERSAEEKDDEWNKKIDTALDTLLRDKIITDEQHAAICRAID